MLHSYASKFQFSYSLSRLLFIAFYTFLTIIENADEHFLCSLWKSYRLQGHIKLTTRLHQYAFQYMKAGENID